MRISTRQILSIPYETVLVSILVLSLIVASIGTVLISQASISQKMLNNARMTALILEDTWQIYSSEVTTRLRNQKNINITHKYRSVEDGIPIPATFTIKLGDTLSARLPNQIFKIYSDYPFRKIEKNDVSLDQFGRDALNFTRNHIGKSFFREEKKEGVKWLRYAKPITMSETCVSCHNTHPDSQKTDWKMGDIRGIIEVSQRYQRFSLFTQGNGYHYILIASIAVFVLAVIGLIIQRLRRSRLEVEKEVRERTAELSYQARMDGLTGIANRRAFDERLEEACTQANPDNHHLTLILCDVDHFKNYNDSYGHPAGDSCLKRIAAEINRTLRRPGDFVARYGGEEFAIILPGSDQVGALAVAELIRKNIVQLGIPHIQSTSGQSVTLSLGVAISNSIDTRIAKSLLTLADNALYQAKSNGRNQSVLLVAELPPERNRSG